MSIKSHARRVLTGLAATVVLLLGTVILASEAGAYTNSPSDTFHWCIGGMYPYGIGYYSQPPERCYSEYSVYTGDLNAGIFGAVLTESFYKDSNYGGWSLAMQSPRTCANQGLFGLNPMPTGWNDIASSMKLWDTSCGTVPLYKDANFNNNYNDYMLDCGYPVLLACKAFPSGVNDQLSSAYVSH